MDELKQAINSWLMSKGGLNTAPNKPSNAPGASVGKAGIDADNPFSGIDFGNL